MERKILILLYICIVCAMGSKKIALNPKDSVYTKSDKTNLKLFGFEQFIGAENINGNGLNFGIHPDLNADVGLGYDIYLNKVGDLIVFNPILYAFIGGPSTFTIDMFFFKLELVIDTDLTKYNLLDY